MLNTILLALLPSSTILKKVKQEGSTNHVLNLLFIITDINQAF